MEKIIKIYRKVHLTQIHVVTDMAWPMMDFTRARSQRKDDGQIKTDTLLDSLVRRMSVYTVATIGLILILKEYLIGKYTYI